MLFRVLLVPTLLAGLCAGQHPRKNNALAPEVRQRAEALLRSAGDPRTSHDEIWRSCCETHGTIQPLLDWLDTKLDGPDSNTTRRLLARIQRRAGHLEPALHTLEAIPAKARTNADEIARAEVLDALGRDTDALAVYTALTKRDLEPALEKKILLRRALMGKRLTALAAFAKDKTKTRAQRNEAAIVLAIMVLPIMTAICREVFLQTPVLHEEAALALGATRWEMIKMAVLPFARGGMVSAAMLALGRALGETMAVTMVLSVSGVVTFELLTATNPTTIPANIALQFPEAYGTGVSLLIATGLVLFVVTFAVNAIARWIVNRRAEFSGAN